MTHRPTRSFLATLGLLSLAVSAAHAAPLACGAGPDVDERALAARVLIVGEVHGTAQAPAFVGHLVCRLLQQGRPVILALERDGAEQAGLNGYLASRGEPADAGALLAQRAWSNTDMQDGRSSQAMLHLIEQVRQWRQGGQPVGVLAMQTDFHEIAPLTTAEPPRLAGPDLDRLSAINDRSMADKAWMTLALNPGYTLVAIAGNYHTALGSKIRQQFAPAPSLADVLASYVPVHVIGLEGRGGQAWNMTNQGAGAHPIMAGSMYLQDARIDSRVDLGAITASPPAATAPVPAPAPAPAPAPSPAR